MKNEKWINELQVGTKSEVIANPYTNEEIELNPQEVAVYDFVKGCEVMGLYGKMQEGIRWFQKNNIKAYITLLD